MSRLGSLQLDSRSGLYGIRPLHCRPVGPHERLRLSIILLFGLAEVGYPLVALGRTYFGLTDAPTIAYAFRIGFLLLSCYVFITQKRRRGDSALLVPLAVFWWLYLLRILYDVRLEPQGIAAGASKVLLYAVGASLLPMLGFLVPPNRRELRAAAIGAVISLAVLCGSVWLLPQTWQALADRGRPSTDVLNSITLGHLGGALAIFTVCLLISKPQSIRLWRVAVATLGFGLGVYTLVGAGSRGPVLAFALMLLLLLIIIARTMHWKVALSVGGVAGLLWITAASLSQLESGVVEAGLDNIMLRSHSEYAEGEDYVRVVLLRDSWAEFLESPIVGSGLIEKHSGEYPHNIIMEAFMATGFIGGTALLLFLWGGVRAAWKIMRTEPDCCWVALLFVQSIVASMTSGALWGWQPLWCFGVATGCLASGLVKRENKKPAPMRFRRTWADPVATTGSGTERVVLGQGD